MTPPLSPFAVAVTVPTRHLTREAAVLNEGGCGEDNDEVFVLQLKRGLSRHGGRRE